MNPQRGHTDDVLPRDMHDKVAHLQQRWFAAAGSSCLLTLNTTPVAPTDNVRRGSIRPFSANMCKYVLMINLRTQHRTTGGTPRSARKGQLRLLRSGGVLQSLPERPLDPRIDAATPWTAIRRRGSRRVLLVPCSRFSRFSFFLNYI